MRKIWKGFVNIVESCLTRIGNFVLGFFKPFWGWLKRILYPYRYFIFALDIILIILLVVVMICSI
ncbi:hypothetical protein [Staphylococcus saprophyticus]|uniref:hypothetical protein n=1 Tax=Staphylococcus saprophyticus TaxID=29385 RepID=UPI0022EB7E66|nr:hypothetical protein [Staphylococcus saprophyticus]